MLAGFVESTVLDDGVPRQLNLPNPIASIAVIQYYREIGTRSGRSAVPVPCRSVVGCSRAPRWLDLGYCVRATSSVVACCFGRNGGVWCRRGGSLVRLPGMKMASSRNWFSHRIFWTSPNPLPMGLAGAGKKFPARALGYSAIRAGHNVRFVHADDFFKASPGPGSTTRWTAPSGHP